jgi:hypothetical protein
LKQQRKVDLKRGGENGVLAAEVVRGKNSKTFQFLSFPFIASQTVENGMRGDPKKSGHPVVNKAQQAACMHPGQAMNKVYVLTREIQISAGRG